MVSYAMANPNIVSANEDWRLLPFDQLSLDQQNDVVHELRGLGLNDSEIESVIGLEKEYQHIEKTSLKVTSKARVGQTRTQTFTISKNTILGTSSASLLAMMVRKGIPTATAGAILTAATGLIADNVSFSGITVTIKYVYGYNNDGVLGWNVGPITWKVKY